MEFSDGAEFEGAGAEAMRKLQPEHDQFHRELDRLLQVLAAQRRLMARETLNSARALHRYLAGISPDRFAPVD